MKPTHLTLAAVAALAAAGAARRGSPARRRTRPVSPERASDLFTFYRRGAEYTLSNEERQIRRLWLNGDTHDQANELRETLGIRLVLSEAKLTHMDLRGEDLQGAIVRRADLYGTDLSSANLKGADLRGSYLSSVDLYKADLMGADLRGARLGHADLRGADLRGADLRDAEVERTDLRGADLRGANLLGAMEIETAQLKNARFDGDTRWPTFDAEAAGAIRE